MADSPDKPKKVRPPSPRLYISGRKASDLDERAVYTTELRRPRGSVRGASESIQIQPILLRGPTLRLIKQRMDEGYSIEPVKRMLAIKFDRAISGVDFVNVLIEAFESAGLPEDVIFQKVTTSAFRREDDPDAPDPEPGKKRKTRRTADSVEFLHALLQHRYDDAERILSSNPDNAVNKIGSIGLLSLTSKMGCFSFNLPPGPGEHYGTCPASAPGFVYSTDADREKASRALLPMAGKVEVPDFICNGCYALKGSYGNPSMAFIFAAHQELVSRHLRPRAGQESFADIMTRAIRMSIELSLDARARAPQRAWSVPHPDYFRIHDAGDMYSLEYARAWFEICQNFPEVQFWAPTRMWALRKQAENLVAEGIPENLALRPSALHFGDRPPVVPGLAAGSGADETAKDAWFCPATSTEASLGGERKGGVARQINKKKTYSCALAHGIDSPSRGGKDANQLPSDGSPKSAGCRVCWDYPDVPVYYHPH
jgi:hypothetical protein